MVAKITRGLLTLSRCTLSEATGQKSSVSKETESGPAVKSALVVPLAE